MRWRRSAPLAVLGLVSIAVAASNGLLPNVRDSLLALVGLTYLAAAFVAGSPEDRSTTYRLTAAAFPVLLSFSYLEYRLALHLAFDAVPSLGFNVLRLIDGVLLVFPVVLGVAWARVPEDRERFLAVALGCIFAGTLLSLIALPIAWFPAVAQVVGVSLVVAILDAVAVLPVVAVAR